MEADKEAAGRLSRVSPPLSSATPPITSLPQPQPTLALAAKQRQMFNVELRAGETTVISWKKLVKESGSGNGEDSAPRESKPALEVGSVAGVQPGGEDLKHTLQPPNCFSTVIEKIERLYMGKESSDEEELVAPDDEQYDTEDSFIDDTELDEYFKVDKLSTKHNGYFVNRGKLEWNESSSSPYLETKKRRRKDSAEVQNEIGHEHVPNEHVNKGNMKIKAAARSAPLVANNLNPDQVVTSFGEHYQEGKLLKIKPNASSVIYKKRSADFAMNLDVSSSARIPNKDVSSASLEPKDVSKNKSLSSKGLYKSSCTSESLDAVYQTSQEKAVASQVKPRPKLFNCENEMDQSPKKRRKDRYKTCEYPQMSSSMISSPTQTIIPLSNRVNEVPIRPKGTTLERAIQDLEKIVALSRPPNPAVQEVDPSGQGVKRRLPQEVKQKLAKVARLSASQGKISEEELIDRLMGFLGHLVQRKTLKRNLREMVELGLSAKQLKADKFLQIKKEILEMIKSRVSILKSKGPDQLDGSADDFQNVISTDERRALTGRYSMDIALEEKLCDLYDLYVEGMDEDKGPQSRKLYVEFAELWPAGYMDNLGIKDAIYRAKKRRQHKVRNKERIERKKLAEAVKLAEPSLITQPQVDQERHMVRTFQVPRPQNKPLKLAEPSLITQPQVDQERHMVRTFQVPRPQNKPLQNKLNDPTSYESDNAAQHYRYGSKHHEKDRGNSTDIISDGGSKIVSADLKKKMKRKSEIEGECHAHPPKMQTRPAKIKHNAYRPNNDSNLSLQQPKPIIQMPAASPTSVQHS